MERPCQPLLLVALLACASATASTDTLRPIGASAALRTLAVSARAQAAPATRPSEIPLRRMPAPPAQGTPPIVAEAAPPQFPLPAGPGTPAMPQVRTGGTGFNIEGLRAGAGGVAGGLGDFQYVQLADGMMAVYRKGDAALLLGPVPANAMFFDAPPGPAADACGAPQGAGAQVQYDQLANRWIVLYRAAAANATYLCVALSASSDATGSYQRYALPVTPYFDDPQLAVWPDAYYISINLFDAAAGSYRGPRICGLERQALLHGLSALMRCRDLGERHAPLVPASLQGYATAPQGSSPALFLALAIDAAGQGERLLLQRFSFSADRLEQALALPVAAFGMACPLAAACIAQPAPGGMLASAGERLLPQPVFRNDEEHGTLLASHAVQMADGQLGLRWYEIRDPLGAARVYQQGSFAPDTTSRWMGSIGMDKAGNSALGYNVAGADTPPGIGYTGRQRTDPPGRMQGEEVIFNGAGVQPGNAPLARASGALALDPIDGCTFWYTQRYLPSTGAANWHTRIARFKFETCN